MGFGQILMPIRAWWFLRIARYATPPPDVSRYLLERIERSRQDVIREGAAAGKTISTEAALKHVLELKTKHDGPNREEIRDGAARFLLQCASLKWPTIRTQGEA
jgi:hypothetical protein